MSIKGLIILIISLLFLGAGFKPAYALQHSQKGGLFSMDIPEGWHWAEDPDKVIIAYPDGKTVAVDIEMVPSRNLSEADIKKTLKDTNDRMVKEGVEAHNGTFLDEKEMHLDGGVYATQLDFKTASPNSIHVTCISFFNKGYAFTITYGSADEKLHSVLDDVVATIKFS